MSALRKRVGGTKQERNPVQSPRARKRGEALGEVIRGKRQLSYEGEAHRRAQQALRRRDPKRPNPTQASLEEQLTAKVARDAERMRSLKKRDARVDTRPTLA